jgi:hypothetical protein
VADQPGVFIRLRILALKVADLLGHGPAPLAMHLVEEFPESYAAVRRSGHGLGVRRVRLAHADLEGHEPTVE